MLKLFKNKKGQLKQSDEVYDANFKAFEVLSEGIRKNAMHIENEFQKAIDKESSLNKSAFSMYVGILINLKNTLDYELLRYGSTESENDILVYKTLEYFIDECRMIITNDNFDFNETYFNLKISQAQKISVNELKRYIFNSINHGKIKKK